MGGNVFDKAKPIPLKNVEPTLKAFYNEFREIFPDFPTDQIVTLGSAGKKDLSGDLDIAIDKVHLNTTTFPQFSKEKIEEHEKVFTKRAKTATKEQIRLRAVITNLGEILEEKGFTVGFKSTSAGTLHILYPQITPELTVNGHVQIDIMFGNVEWLRFAYYSKNYDGNVKGLHRTQLLVALFSEAGYTFSHSYGIKKKDTQEIVAKTVEEAKKILKDICGLTDDEILHDYYKLGEYIVFNCDPAFVSRIFKTYLKILDSTRVDIPENLQPVWIEYKEELELTGKFLPENSKLQKYIK